MMALERGTVATAALLLVLACAGGASPLRAAREDTEDDLGPRIEREHDPVKKAKFKIRLGRLNLAHAGEACQKDDHEACHKFLDAFLDLIKSSWKDLEGSGKNAVKQPSGFRELDIALREDAHTLEDMKRRLPLEDRDALDPVIQETNKIHDQVFGALFPRPGGRPREPKPNPPAAPQTGTGRG